MCEEKLEDSYERIDELFYYTMKAIVEHLGVNTCVVAPVDNGRDLTSIKSDIQRMINWKNRLKSKLENLEILFKDDCSKGDAIQAWYGFFNHDYWSEQSTEIPEYESKTVLRTICSFDDTEE